MSFMILIKSRHSVRSYKDVPVEKEKLLQMIEAARNAPSATNAQPWHFIVVTDKQIKDELAETYPREWFKSAPAIIVACGDHSRSWKRKDGKDHCDIDIAIAVDHMMLAATELGLGACWVCAFDAEKCHEILHLPQNLEVIVLIPVGYPDEKDQKEKKRKNIGEIVSWNRFKTE
ncbi:MAG: nitroreductase [Clostridiaceae bacterium]|nr:nitroreductase [Clostridiaceae bacterium]